MEFSAYFPMWDKLTAAQQKRLADSITPQTAPKGTIVHNGSLDCVGLLLIQSGQLRSYILSDEGREVTLYRLFDRDLCLFSASCMMPSIQFDLVIEAEKDTGYWLIPTDVYKSIMEQSAPLANYTNEIMASRFSEVMWLIEQIMWKSLDKRVASFLLEEAAIEGTNLLKLTHETIANHLGTHREVISRMLKYFQNEGMVKLSRGMIEITDSEKLEGLCTNGYKNACSRLYSACVRIAKEMGYKKVITYILESENGASLKASNFVNEGIAGGKIWTGSRNRDNGVPKEVKQRWVYNL